MAELRVPAPQFLLAEAMDAAPEMVVEFEQFVPSSDRVMPFLWATGGGHRECQSVLSEDPHTDDVRLLDALDSGGLFHVDWADDNTDLLQGLQGEDEALLRAVGRDAEWFLKVRFSSRESLSSFHTYCAEEDVEFTLLKLYEMEAPKLGRYGLTVAQREALLTALEMGYFDVPRDATLQEVATELGRSPNATSERIRRGQANLFRSTLRSQRPTHDHDPV